LITHIDEGLVFLGWRIQRHRKRGTNRSYVYTYPAPKAVRAVTGKVKTLCRRMDTNQPLEVLLLPLNRLLRPLPARRVQRHLRLPAAYTWARVIGWLRRKHRRITWKELRRRYCAGGWWPSTKERQLFNPAKVRTTRYRYRGTVIPTPWPVTG
jgi:RNA-directed DNA polymerase